VRRALPWLVAAVALAVRLAFLLRVPQPGAGQLAAYAADSVHYVAMAERLLAGHGYSFWGQGPDAYVSPGYPLFVALFFRLAPQHALVALRDAQAVLGAATCGVLAAWAGPLAGLLAAFYPPFVWATGSVLTEVLFTFLFVAYLVLHARLPEARGRGPALAAGVLLGLAVLTRPTVAPVPFVVAAVEWLVRRRRGIGRFGSLLAAAGITNLPWWLRNLLVLHKPIFFAAQSSNPLLGGLAPDGGVAAPPGVNPMHFALQYVLQQLRHNRQAFLHWMTVGKLRLIFGVYPGGTATGGFLAGLAAMQRPLLAVGGAGLLLAAFLAPRLRPAAVAAATLTVAQLAFIPANRYNFPVMTLLCAGAGWLLGELLRRIAAD
jgi:4-amino-4-deoxy-L-arabinose transferase-like glycosyltransferase